MPTTTTTTPADPLNRAERQLRVLTRGRERAVLHRWEQASTDLAAARLTRPAELRGWLRRRPTPAADEVLRSLVTLAQRGDPVALLAVLVCLAPGIRALARQTAVTPDEAMSEVTLGVLEYPVARRRSVASGLLLDARNRITRSHRRTPRPTGRIDDDDTTLPHNHGAPAGQPSTAERVLALVCEARRRHVVGHADAQLIVDTRLNGQRVAPAAARLGISPQAAYQRRTRAESRMATLA